jgi:hypothetical protein
MKHYQYKKYDYEFLCLPKPHFLDAWNKATEEQITALLSEQIAMEIDMQILDKLRKNNYNNYDWKIVH